MPALPIMHSVVLCMSMKPAVCSPHHSRCAICCRNEIKCFACSVEAVSVRTVKAMYEEDSIFCTAATIFSGFLCSTESPASFYSAQVHRSEVNPLSTVLKLMGGR